LLGPQSTGEALAWIGSAMFAAFALGAPPGSALYARWGFAAVTLATIFLPLATLLFVAPLPRVAAAPRAQVGLVSVMAAVWAKGEHNTRRSTVIGAPLNSGDRFESACVPGASGAWQ
jgi:class 3 adenylate cyclase